MSSCASTARTTSRCTTSSRPAPAWRTCSRACATEGRRLGIVTAKRRATVELAFARVPLAHLFEMVVGGDETERHKPDPEPLLLAAARMGAEPRRRRLRRRLAVRHAGREGGRHVRVARHAGAASTIATRSSARSRTRSSTARRSCSSSSERRPRRGAARAPERGVHRVPRRRRPGHRRTRRMTCSTTSWRRSRPTTRSSSRPTRRRSASARRPPTSSRRCATSRRWARSRR